MGVNKNQDYILNESEQYYTGKEISEMDEILYQISDMFRKLCKAYSLAIEKLDEKNKNLIENEDLKSKNDLLRQENCAFEEQNRNLKEKQEDLQNNLKESKLHQEEYRKHYDDMKKAKEQAELTLTQTNKALEQEKKTVEKLMNDMSKESIEKNDKANEVNRLQELLNEKCQEVDALRKYELQMQKMPKTMQLYEVYNSVMERRTEFPKEYSECLKRAMPLDNFDCFLSGLFDRYCPISYYLSIQAFIKNCCEYEIMSRDVMKNALYNLDRLLAAIFSYGSEFYEKERLFRMNCKAGEQYDSRLCIYMYKNGGMYGNIGKVWLQGLDDKKDNKIYHSYVEGE